MEKDKEKSLSGTKRRIQVTLDQHEFRREGEAMQRQETMLTIAAYALVHIKRILIQGESGYSAVVTGGCTKTISMMKILMSMANCALFVERNSVNTNIFWLKYYT